MVDLKTLKNILSQDGEYADITEREANISLRIEAIRWVKKLNEIDIGGRHTGSSDFQNIVDIGGLKLNVWAENYEHYGAKSFIIHFFNLTKEDLK